MLVSVFPSAVDALQQLTHVSDIIGAAVLRWRCAPLGAQADPPPLLLVALSSKYLAEAPICCGRRSMVIVTGCKAVALALNSQLPHGDRFRVAVNAPR